MKQGNLSLIFKNHYTNCFYIFLFSDLLYQIVIKGNIFGDSIKIVSAFEACTSQNRVFPCILFQNTDPTVFVLCVIYYFTYSIKAGIEGDIFGN